ncbi:MAG TPA: AMP-binding protein [Solirubrobacterales bacterium]
MQLFDALTAEKRQSFRWWDRGSFAEVPWNGVVADAHRAGLGSRRAGIGAGTPVACVLTNSFEVVRGMLGVWLAGGAVASLPVPARAMSIEDYASQLVAICRHLGSHVLLIEDRLIEALREPIDGEVELVGWSSLPVDGSFEPTPPGEDEPAFIQYSSGSTSRPKGCVLTPRAMGTQLKMIGDMLEAAPGDSFSSWLPLSHDMGAFGCLLFPWAYDLPLALSSPERFVVDPRTWLGDIAEFGATISAGPPSALNIATRAERRSPQPGSLHRLKSCVIGGESIAWSVLEAATEAFAPKGLSAEMWMPAYGMAEATLVVSSIDVAARPSFRRVDSAALANEELVYVDEHGDGTTEIVSTGRPRGEAGVRVEEPDRLSQIHVRSPSLATGYHREGELTAERFSDGELATGDLGFMHGDELYVVGRRDDMLSVGGRNVYAREIESAVDLLDAVRSGCSTVIDAGAGNRARLVMLLELRDEGADLGALAAEASRTAKQKAGVLLDECVFLPPGALPKTPSGKIQRFRCRHLLATDVFEPLDRVKLKRALA